MKRYRLTAHEKARKFIERLDLTRRARVDRFYDLFEELKPAMYYSSRYFKRDFLNPYHKNAVGWEIDWETMVEFCKKVEEFKISPNYVPMVGHGNLRLLTMGLDFERRATETEIEAMKPHLRQALEDGCRGMSVGRDYDPGYWADKPMRFHDGM